MIIQAAGEYLKIWKKDQQEDILPCRVLTEKKDGEIQDESNEL